MWNLERSDLTSLKTKHRNWVNVTPLAKGPIEVRTFWDKKVASGNSKMSGNQQILGETPPPP